MPRKIRIYSAPKGMHSSHKMVEIHQRTKHWKCVLLLLLLLETTTFEAKNHVRKDFSMLRMIWDFNHGFYSKNPEMVWPDLKFGFSAIFGLPTATTH